MAANGHRHLATPSHIRPRNACSGGTSSLACHHPATLWNRLILKQVCGQSVLSLLIPRQLPLARLRLRRCLATSLVSWEDLVVRCRLA
jgi:hypothetical protein